MFGSRRAPQHPELAEEEGVAPLLKSTLTWQVGKKKRD